VSHATLKINGDMYTVYCMGRSVSWWLGSFKGWWCNNLGCWQVGSWLGQHALPTYILRDGASYDTAAASTFVKSGLPLPLLLATRYMELLGEVCKGLPSLANVVNPTESQVIQALFSTAAEASIVTLQNRIEAMCYNLGKQATKRDATAGGCACYSV